MSVSDKWNTFISWVTNTDPIPDADPQPTWRQILREKEQQKHDALLDIADALKLLSLRSQRVDNFIDTNVTNDVKVNVEAAETTALVDRFALALVEATGKGALGYSPALLSKYGDDVYKVANALIVARNRNYQEIQEASWSRIGR